MPAAIAAVSCLFSFPISASYETCFFLNTCSQFSGFMPVSLIKNCILKALLFNECLQPFLWCHALFPFNNCILKGLSLVNACSRSSGFMPFGNRTNGIETA